MPQSRAISNCKVSASKAQIAHIYKLRLFNAADTIGFVFSFFFFCLVRITGYELRITDGTVYGFLRFIEVLVSGCLVFKHSYS